MTMTSSSTPPSTSVRVGVRVRPLVGDDSSRICRVSRDKKEIRMTSATANRVFSYDEVFDEQISQKELYQQIAKPLLQSVIDGYNATIMAYGQTGSGKTFTMGSSSNNDKTQQVFDDSAAGLIPRFMKDLFHCLSTEAPSSGPKDDPPTHRRVGFQLYASFLEVYGEDIYDLLDRSPSEKRHDKASLPLREDGNGGVVCQGLIQRQILTAQDAMEVLHEGTNNRTTAATLMNLTSSRSHAVFSITLDQAFQKEGDPQITRKLSKFTFVDLAGSERMKKTGAEGERAREGIKINEGLLALGNVIHALSSSDHGESSNRQLHVPYRQSKLTRLLRDALGGNSQTLFLACVSPAESNLSETLSTLYYAQRARHIQNIPTQNTIQSAGLSPANEEALRYYQGMVQVLRSELVKEKFVKAHGLDPTSPLGKLEDNSIWERDDVQGYLKSLESIVNAEHGSVSGSLAVPSSGPPTQPIALNFLNQELVSFSEDLGNRSLLETVDQNMLTDVNPDEEMAILDQLLELQQRDEEFGKTQRKETEELRQMDGELAEQEVLLLQLKESLKVYHNMKAKYERLMAEVQQLENEKKQLADQLDALTHDTTQGGKSSKKAIERELAQVEKSLARARNETRKHREMYRKAEQEAQKCKVLEQKVLDLRHSRATLIRKQKESASRHREYTETKTREILALKRKDRKNEKRMTKLESEIGILRKNLEKRHDYENKLNSKLKQTEKHLMKVMSLRRKELNKKDNQNSKGAEGVSASEVQSMVFSIQKQIKERVHQAVTNRRYEERLQDYSEAMRSMIDCARQLREARSSGIDIESIRELENSVQELESKTDAIGADLEILRHDVNELDQQRDSSPTHLLSNKKPALLKATFASILEQHTELQINESLSQESVIRKEAALKSYEAEVEILNDTVAMLTDKLEQHRSAETGDSRFVKLDELQSENEFLEKSFKECKELNLSLNHQVSTMKENISKLEIELVSMQERVVVADQFLKHGSGTTVPDDFLRDLQAIWSDVGVSSDQRSEGLLQIENCFEISCQRVLDQARDLQRDVQQKASDLTSSLRKKYEQLGIDKDPCCRKDSQSLLEHVASLEVENDSILSVYESSLSKKNDFTNQLNGLILSLDLVSSDLPLCLKLLLDENSTDRSDIGLLKPDFLDQCEKEIQKIRCEKIEVITENSELQARAFQTVQDMNIGEAELLSLLTSSIRNRDVPLPAWWSDDVSRSVVRSIATDGGLIRANKSFSNHLKLFCDMLTSLSTVRRKLSDQLRSIIERAQKALLNIVDSEGDVSDVCSSFHEALFRLPPLSKDRINACVKEICALVSGVESMIQSEIEALSVVWEALGVSSGDRGVFWQGIEESILSIETRLEGPFDSIIQMSYNDTEEWLLFSIKEATKVYIDLESKLCKLDKVHAEVEKLRFKQDSKSSILSLDSEIRILNAKLSEFEDEKCNKQRLLTKKSGGTSLLREERFRKQMQTKFSNKLDDLAKLLRAWVSDEGRSFDAKLLSDEVRELLDNLDNTDALVEKRTEFMHLRTVKIRSSPRKRASQTDQKEGSLPPRKRQTTAASRNRLAEPSSLNIAPHSSLPPKPRPKRQLVDKENNTAFLDYSAKLSVQASSDADTPKNQSDIGRGSSSICEKSTKRLTLPPFGHILEQAMTPKKTNKS